MKILIIGHACSPRKGSEPGFTWNWAWHLSSQHQVWVIAHPYDREGVSKFLENHPRPSMRFKWVDIPRCIDPWAQRSNGRGLRFHYMLWLHAAFKEASRLHEQVGFDIVHHVSYGSVSAPPPVHTLGIPFVWGPIGGAQQAPSSFRGYFGRTWPREIARNARVRLLPFSPSLRSAVRASLVTLATNQETADLLRRAGARDVRLFLDSGIPQSFLSNGIYGSNDEGLTLLWAGRMQPRKALPLALEALAEASDVNVRLLVVGDGQLRESWEDCARRLHVEAKVTFLGEVSWDDMPRLYQKVDAFLFTSLRDSFGMQVLEAMGHALPILTLDHQGVRTFVPPDAGIKIPVTTPQETSKGIAEGIRLLARNPDVRRRLGEAGRAFAGTQTWEKRAEWMSKLYEEVTGERVSVRLGAPVSYGSYGVEKRIEKIDEMLDLRGKRVLDLGCGNGSYTAELARRAAFVCGVDLQMQHLQA